MFIRFTAVRKTNRLAADLVRTYRDPLRDGNDRSKVRTQYVGRCASAPLPEPISLIERIRFWSEVEARLRSHPRLALLSPADRRKAVAAIEQRIPKPTAAELAQVFGREAA